MNIGALVDGRSLSRDEAAGSFAIGDVPVTVILSTGDGGATWRAQGTSSTGSGAGIVSGCSSDAEHGWAVVTNLLSSAHSPFIVATGK
jgi:hypothetical protein